MSRAATCALLALALAGCAVTTRREEIKNIGGRDYICTWVEDKISHDVSDYTCYPATGVQP